MSVRVEERTESKLALFIQSRSLAKYTIQITSNPKVFKPEYQSAITDRIVAAALAIHEDLWMASNIKVTSKVDYAERRNLQNRACEKCNSLLSLIDIAKDVFHLSSKRIVYWAGLAISVRDAARDWKNSDA